MSTVEASTETVVPSSSVLSQSLFLGHLYSYPAVNAAVDYTLNIPSVQNITTKAIPIVNSLKEKSKPFTEPVIKRASPVLVKADQLGDKILSRVDESFPQLKETKSEDVIEFARKPFESVKSTADAYSTAAHDRINVNLVDPIKKAGERAKTHYNTVYDKTGKPLIKNQVDPYMVSVNHKIEEIITHYLPEGTEIPPKTADENEISRTLALTQFAFQKAKPYIDQQTGHIANIPHATREHVQKIYDEKLAEYEADKTHTSPIYDNAYIATLKQLYSEGMMFAGSLLSAQVIYLKNTLASPKNDGTKEESKVVVSTDTDAPASEPPTASADPVDESKESN